MQGREIKFRAWDKKQNKMVDMNHLRHHASGFRLLDEGREYEFMQFTGLRDKNGREIYEGDIVSLHLDANETRQFEVAIQTVTREVVSHKSFADATAKVAITGVVFKWEGFELFPCVENGIPDNLKMVVIGNIYENPELLEVNND